MQNGENIDILLGINRKQMKLLTVFQLHGVMENMAQGSNTADWVRQDLRCDFSGYGLVPKEQRNQNSEY